MIRELICYRCICSKCGHQWTTKGHELPWNCAKCKSRLWNSDYKLNNVIEDLAPAARIVGKAKRLDGVPMNDAMSSFLTKAIIEEVEADEPEEEDEPDNQWEGWSDELEEYDGATGETIVYRKQLVKPFKIQEVRRDH